MIHDCRELEKYLNLWQLREVSPALRTATSQLQQVQDSAGNIRMLKITDDVDEIRGIQQLATWFREGCAASVAVFGVSDCAILLDYAKKSRSLLPEALNPTTHLAATKRLVNNVWQLHQVSLDKFSDLRSLNRVFESLFADFYQSSLLQLAQKIAKELLLTASSNVPLHGDAHHGNMLYFSNDQVQVIDPKGVHGEHYFDYIPIFMNPDLGDIRLNKTLFEEKLFFLCDPDKGYQLERARLIKWIFASTALSAVWFLEDDLQREADQQLGLLQWIVDEYGFLKCQGH